MSIIGTLLAKLLARYGLYLALTAGIGVAALAWDRSRVNKGVEKERVRVETTGRKIDAKAATARRAAESQPHDSLRGYYRD